MLSGSVGWGVSSYLLLLVDVGIDALLQVGPRRWADFDGLVQTFAVSGRFGLYPCINHRHICTVCMSLDCNTMYSRFRAQTKLRKRAFGVDINRCMTSSHRKRLLGVYRNSPLG